MRAVKSARFIAAVFASSAMAPDWQIAKYCRVCEKELPSWPFVAPTYRIARRYRSLITCRSVIVRSFAPGARDIELLALRFVTQRFRSRADHLASVRSRPLQHSLPADSALLCPGLERSTVFAPATMPARSDQAS